MRIGIQFCYKSNTVNGEDHMNLFNLFVKFIPDKISINYNVANWNEARSKLKISNSRKSDNIIVSRPLEIFISTEIKGQYNYRNIKIVSIVSKEELNEILQVYSSNIDKIFSENENVISCFFYNEDFVSQQSAYNESLYQVNKIPLSLSDGLPFKVNEWGEKEFDISNNVGQVRKWENRIFTPSWRMWFNLRYVSAEMNNRLIEFPYFNKSISENKILRADLYASLIDASNESERRIQKKFNDWIKLDN